MYELKISVGKVLGTCTAEPPMKRGDHFSVRDGDITIPGGGYICLWALQSLMPLITPKEREIAERQEDDWMWRVNHAQCPDPKGRVIFKIERVARIDKLSTSAEGDTTSDVVSRRADFGDKNVSSNPDVRDLRVVVEQVKGKCTSHLKPGDGFILRSGRLYIPAGKHFCLYALQATLPLLPAKQRTGLAGDWMAEDDRVICPDPAGNVIMRIEPL